VPTGRDAGGSCGCVVTGHVLIRGDLLCVQFDENGARCSNTGRNAAEVSSGRSSDARREAPIAKDQRSRTGQRLWALDTEADVIDRILGHLGGGHSTAERFDPAPPGRGPPGMLPI
jgi:hypothetical protein